MDYSAYRKFIADKQHKTVDVGFEAKTLSPKLFAHQKTANIFACQKGKAALFLDTGLGKTGCEVTFANECVRGANKPSLILTPLAVAKQMQDEAARIFDIETKIIRDQDDIYPGVNIMNYERLKNIDPSCFGSVVLDESSVLKSYGGRIKNDLIAKFKDTPYKLAATATPAPNDHMEIGNHAEFLNVMGSMEMLCRWFVNDTSEASQKWRLKGHARADFWAWVASWARAASLPSDLGGDDTGYILPKLLTNIHVVDVDRTEDAGDMLFRIPDQSATSIHKEKRLTIEDRMARAIELANTGEPCIIWCETNDESSMLAAGINDCIEVKGSMNIDQKEAALWSFTSGKARAIVTKKKIAGFGLNWQHCNHQVHSSISYSYEAYYQAVRRSWRFGQKRPVKVDVVMSDTERGVWNTIERKSRDHDSLKQEMSKAMRGAQGVTSKKAYLTEPDFIFPEWLKSEVA